MEKDKNVIKMLRKSPLHNEAKRLVKEAHENYLKTLREFGENSDRTKTAYDAWVASIDYRLAVYKMVVEQIRTDAQIRASEDLKKALGYWSNEVLFQLTENYKEDVLSGVSIENLCASVSEDIVNCDELWSKINDYIADRIAEYLKEVN